MRSSSESVFSPSDPTCTAGGAGAGAGASVTRGASVVDEVNSYTAFRNVTVLRGTAGGAASGSSSGAPRTARLALNGAPYYMAGLLDQGYWPDGLYTAPSDEALASDIVAAKVRRY